MHRNDDWHLAAQRRRVLHVKQVRTIGPHPSRQVEAQTQKRIGRDPPGQHRSRQRMVRLGGRRVGYELAVPLSGGQCVQKTSNVNLIPGEVPADGVSINGNAHYPYQYTGA
jgi:hypothetical protein